jgi:NADP-dependent 3-hydroxy acid dehydrogenase YdfG
MPIEVSALTLAGRVSLVSGAGSGIGRAIAETFARSGAALALCDRDGERLLGVEQALARAGTRVAAEVFDARDASALRRFVERPPSSATSMCS